MKVMIIVGTRPEVIKMVPVIKALRESGANTIVCATGQHREMLAQALDVFSITPEISLDVMSPGQSLNVLSARLLTELDRVLDPENNAVTLATLSRAAHALGKRLRVTLEAA